FVYSTFYSRDQYYESSFRFWCHRRIVSALDSKRSSYRPQVCRSHLLQRHPRITLVFGSLWHGRSLTFGRHLHLRPWGSWEQAMVIPPICNGQYGWLCIGGTCINPLVLQDEPYFHL